MDDDNSFPSSFLEPWRELLHSRQDEQQDDFPDYHVRDPDVLVTESVMRSLYVGTGYSIFKRAILPAILSATDSVAFVTCYWAASPTREALRETLIELARIRAQSGTTEPLSVTIGFSSSGVLQKLLHTSSRGGRVYPPSQWAKLGLPSAEELAKGGIELTVKSIFFLPFSVMHPKYLIVDGKRAWVPSCNVSWERWFEGCVEIQGNVVSQLSRFHERVWGGNGDNTLRDPRKSPSVGVDRLNVNEEEEHMLGSNPQSHARTVSRSVDETSASQTMSLADARAVPTIFLPSPHHRYPGFSIFPLLSQKNPPMTPLNAALLTLFANATRSITILTPNVTSQPVLDALLQALERGVNVQIRTSKNMMLIEQLVTAGTTTAWCLDRFIRDYKTILGRRGGNDVEAQPTQPGDLEVLYYRPMPGRQEKEDEPVLSHFKMTLVDDEYLVLGSGNMDRASWWTSQELGVLFYIPRFKGNRVWDKVLDQRTEVVFRSLRAHQE